MFNTINKLLSRAWFYAIILFLIKLTGYYYMVSYLGYFNVDKSFYIMNIFNDFSGILMVVMLFSIPVISSIIIGLLFYEISLNISIKKLKKLKVVNIIKILCCLLFSVICVLGLCIYIFRFYNIYNICNISYLCLSILFITVIIKYICWNYKTVFFNINYDKF